MPVTELENIFIPLDGGRHLSARIWLPDGASGSPVPAILEYLPYRKRDGTAYRDEGNYPVFAEAGYAGVRVDISGTGESDGDFDDEYSPRELADALEVIDWIASQPWCDGNLGMMGISWGGFNSLQVAALQPAPLKAVIAVGTTVDRYNDDIHYKNGCHLYSNFMWSSTMLCYTSRPPDPLLVGDRWKEMWKHRLDTQPYPMEIWLAHQRRDEYWKHGSVGENYEDIRIPSLVISGWADLYINAPPAMAANNRLSRAINGPWIHKYPHIAWPKPGMDFLAQAICWWNQWLRGQDSQVMQTPAYTAYISEGVRPGGFRDFEPGRWVAEDNWPSANISTSTLYLTADHALRSQPQNAGVSMFQVHFFIVFLPTWRQGLHPRRTSPDNRMQKQQPLAHHRHQGHLARLAPVPQSPVKTPHPRIVTNRRQRRHIQRTAHRLAATPNAAFALMLTTVARPRRQTRQRAQGLARTFSQFRQMSQQHAYRNFSNAFDTSQQSRSLGQLAFLEQRAQRRVDAFDLPTQPRHVTTARGPDPSRRILLQTVHLLNPLYHQLFPTIHLFPQMPHFQRDRRVTR